MRQPARPAEPLGGRRVGAIAGPHRADAPL